MCMLGCVSAAAVQCGRSGLVGRCMRFKVGATAFELTFNLSQGTGTPGTPGSPGTDKMKNNDRCGAEYLRDKVKKLPTNMPDSPHTAAGTPQPNPGGTRCDDCLQNVGMPGGSSGCMH